MSSALNLPPSALGPAFAFMGFGSVVGSFAGTPLADRIGRKPVIIGALLFAMPFLLLISISRSLVTFVCWQFFAGFGLMGTIPIILSLAGEFMPKRSHVTLTMLVWVGFNIGSLATGLVGARLATMDNWHGIFLVNGAIVIAVCLILAAFLPESLDFLAERHDAEKQIAGNLRRLNPGSTISEDANFVLEEREEKGFPVSLLFQEGRGNLSPLGSDANLIGADDQGGLGTAYTDDFHVAASVRFLKSRTGTVRFAGWNTKSISVNAFGFPRLNGFCNFRSCPRFIRLPSSTSWHPPPLRPERGRRPAHLDRLSRDPKHHYAARLRRHCLWLRYSHFALNARIHGNVV